MKFLGNPCLWLHTHNPKKNAGRFFVAGALDHIVRIRPLQAQQVDEHVVAQVEGAKDLGALAQEHLLGHLRLHLMGNKIPIQPRDGW